MFLRPILATDYQNTAGVDLDFKIRASVAEEFAKVDEMIVDLLQSDVAMVENIGQYIVKAGGKRIRPLLVLLTAKALGGVQREHIQFAAVVEFIHTATLLHDDVVDLSTLRRGMPTANAAFGNAPSVLVGDFIYTRAFQLMVQLGNIELLAHMAETTNTIAAGEVLQLMHAGNPDTSTEQYEEIIRRKTAVLFAAACHGAALLSGCSAQKSGILRDFGLNLGMTYQLADDLLDYTGDPSQTGKNVGDDLNEGKVTLPLIHAMRQGNKSERTRVAEVLQQKNGAAFDEIMEIVKRTGGIEATKATAGHHQQLALDALDSLPRTKAVGGLKSIVKQAVDRKN